MWMECQAIIHWVLCLTIVLQATTFLIARQMEESEVLFHSAKLRRLTWRMLLRESSLIRSLWEISNSTWLSSSTIILMESLTENYLVRIETRTVYHHWGLTTSNTTQICSNRTNIIRSQGRGQEDPLISICSWVAVWEEHSNKQLQVEDPSTTTAVPQAIPSSTKAQTISRQQSQAQTPITTQWLLLWVFAAKNNLLHLLLWVSSW